MPRRRSDLPRDIAQRLERHPGGETPQPLDFAAWLEFRREFGLVPESSSDDVRSAWAALLAELMPSEYRERKPPRKATAALPGTEEKVRAMEERRRKRQGLWHDDDAAYREAA